MLWHICGEGVGCFALQRVIYGMNANACAFCSALASGTNRAPIIEEAASRIVAQANVALPLTSTTAKRGRKATKKVKADVLCGFCELRANELKKPRDEGQPQEKLVSCKKCGQSGAFAGPGLGCLAMLD